MVESSGLANDSVDYESEYYRLQRIVSIQEETIENLEAACLNLAIALRNKGEM